MKANALITIACVLGASACNPCERDNFIDSCGFFGKDVECASSDECTAPKHCLPCGVCVADDECGTLAGTCSDDEPCRIGESCNASCGCVLE